MSRFIAPLLRHRQLAQCWLSQWTSAKGAVSSQSMTGGVCVATLEKLISDALKPIHQEITDISGGCGKSFDIFVVSQNFAQKPLIKRHRLVNAAIESHMAEIHALTLKTLTPEEWQQSQAAAASTPKN